MISAVQPRTPTDLDETAECARPVAAELIAIGGAGTDTVDVVAEGPNPVKNCAWLKNVYCQSGRQFQALKR